MQIALLLVFLGTIALVLLCYAYSVKDGFLGSESAGSTLSDFVADRQAQFGGPGLLLVKGKNDGLLGESASNILNPPNDDETVPLHNAPTGLFAITNTCEAIKTMDCSAFDNPNFSLNCGICLDIGKNSKGAAIPGGGLVVLADDKNVSRQTKTSNFMPTYTPTSELAFCPAGKLVSTKAECQALQRKLLCQKNKSFDLAGCSQCYTGGNYEIVDPVKSPGIITGHGTLYLVGSGNLTIQESGFGGVTKTLSPSMPYSYSIRGNEGDRIRLAVTSTSNDSSCFIAGYIFGETFSGEFTHDLRKIIISDETTGRKPRSSGKLNVNDTPVSKMSPGFGEKNMALIGTVPFSFVDTVSEEASLCRDGPYSTLASSAVTDPCYANGAGPGNYNLECLQNIWMSNGCTQSGAAYPGSNSNASKLMVNLDGTLRTSNDIADYIYNKALVTYTGMNQYGQQESLTSWSSASVFCTGKPIESPCEGPTKSTGPLSANCIVYLWKNEGSTNSLGPTYSSIGHSLSGTSPVPQFCQATGSVSPIDSNGKINNINVTYWQGQGGVDSVKNMMSNIYKEANSPSLSDDKRLPYLSQCYGITKIASRPVAPPPPPKPTYKCPNSSRSLIQAPFLPKQNTIINSNISLPNNYILTMHLTLQGPADGWASLIHFTTGQDAGPFGTRTLGIWFYPGSTNKLAIHIDHSTQPGWAARVNDQAGLTVPFVIGKTSVFALTCSGPIITITLDGKICGTFQRDGTRYTGPVTVYGSNPWYNSANCNVETVCIQSL